jgi:hypothetical protein
MEESMEQGPERHAIRLPVWQSLRLMEESMVHGPKRHAIRSPRTRPHSTNTALTTPTPWDTFVVAIECSLRANNKLRTFTHDGQFCWSLVFVVGDCQDRWVREKGNFKQLDCLILVQTPFSASNEPSVMCRNEQQLSEKGTSRSIALLCWLRPSTGANILPEAT